MARIYKDQFAQDIGVSKAVLRRVCNKELHEQLLPTGYRKNQRHLTDSQLKILKEYGFY